MSMPYAETLCGEMVMRSAPGRRHEIICTRLHQYLRASVANLSSARLLPPRTRISLRPDLALCPDLALLAAANGKLWLAAEIVNSEDHRPDTVVKKQIYEEIRLPRLWMIDPRYDNVEVYHSSPYGLALKGILAGRDILTESLLPEFEIAIAKLFETPSPP